MEEEANENESKYRIRALMEPKDPNDPTSTPIYDALDQQRKHLEFLREDMLNEWTRKRIEAVKMEEENVCEEEEVCEEEKVCEAEPVEPYTYAMPDMRQYVLAAPHILHGRVGEKDPEFNRALARAMAKMPLPKRNKTNDYHGSKYAELAEVLDCSRAHLLSEGLIPTQIIYPGIMLTQIVNENDNGIQCWAYLPIIGESYQYTDKHGTHTAFVTAQFLKSNVTYTRRTSWLALCNLSDDDDDGNVAANLTQTREPNKTNPGTKFAGQALPPIVTTQQRASIQDKIEKGLEAQKETKT